MSIELTSFYLDNVTPLCRVDLDELEAGCKYITADGSRIKVIEDSDGSLDIVIDKQSPLNEGERVSTLAESGVKLLFKILNKKND